MAIHKEVADFHAAYAEKLIAASISAEHTATEGWQLIYTAHRKAMKEARLLASSMLAETAAVLRQRFTDEGEEKGLGDMKKQLAELRASNSAFTTQVMDPILEPKLACETCIHHWQMMADEAYRQSPLHTRGLVEAMREATNSVPRVRFDDEYGRLIVG